MFELILLLTLATTEPKEKPKPDETCVKWVTMDVLTPCLDDPLDSCGLERRKECVEWDPNGFKDYE